MVATVGLCALCTPIALAEPLHQFRFDASLYEQFGKFAIQRVYPVKIMPDFSKPAMASAIDGSGRRFIYVGFEGLPNTSGAAVVFELCDDNRWPVLVLGPDETRHNHHINIKQELNNFLHIRGDKAADYPHGCDNTMAD